MQSLVHVCTCYLNDDVDGVFLHCSYQMRVREREAHAQQQSACAGLQQLCTALEQVCRMCKHEIIITVHVIETLDNDIVMQCAHRATGTCYL
jgi:hypothetical protein